FYLFARPRAGLFLGARVPRSAGCGSRRTVRCFRQTPSRMTQSDIPENLRGFVHDCIPHVDAAEVLLLLAREPARPYTLPELVDALRAAEVSAETVQKYLSRFESFGLVAHAAGAYRYSPPSAECEAIIDA